MVAGPEKETAGGEKLVQGKVRGKKKGTQQSGCRKGFHRTGEACEGMPVT
jgi:hypothetical protein